MSITLLNTVEKDIYTRTRSSINYKNNARQLTLRLLLNDAMRVEHFIFEKNLRYRNIYLLFTQARNRAYKTLNLQ